MSARNPDSSGNQRVHKYKDRAFALSYDQENYSQRELEAQEKSGLHRTAPHDGRFKEGIRKRPARPEHEDETGPDDAALSQHNPVAPALMHGNQPSRGAKIDEELMHDDELRIRQKDGVEQD